MLEDYKITSTEEEKIKSVTDRANKEILYMDFVKTQEEGFIKIMQFVNTTIYLLKRRAYISPYIEIRARIKGTESALHNYEDNRMLDDVFGIEIICATEREIEIIKSTLEEVLISNKRKEFDKSNGYKAKHESYSVNQTTEAARRWKICGETVPLVEFQYKTIEVELNPEASHHDYKKIDKKSTQEMLENNVLEIGKQLPRMWVSRENGIQELDYEEIVQRVYTFVDVTRIKVPEEKNKSNRE